MRFPDDDEQQQEDRSRHGCRGRGRWGRNVSGLEARFLEDVTIEDGTVVEAGKPLRKMWKLVNDGERSWPDGCYMITQAGNPVFPEDWKSSRIDLPALAPGEEFIAGVDLVAPSKPGRYSSFWRVCDPADVSFGHRFWIDIVVAGDNIWSKPSEAATANNTEDVEIEDSSEVATDALSDDDIEIIDSAEAQGADGVAEEVVISEKKDKVDNADYEEALELLASMGFADKEKNVRALELADGNVGGAVNALLSE
ncbi:hypothetical protein PF007_g5650 [Phytophthora fragariae]|nr:hypothetical protein PF007_g5650 [Phytophthora fragariae]